MLEKPLKMGCSGVLLGLVPPDSYRWIHFPMEGGGAVVAHLAFLPQSVDERGFRGILAQPAAILPGLPPSCPACRPSRLPADGKQVVPLLACWLDTPVIG
jgi:hypothetical protein